MTRTLSTTLMILIVAISVFSQKRTTVFGDTWIGVIVAANDDTREITLSSTDPNKPETFVGILQEGYKHRQRDGSKRDFKVSELKPGVRIRVFYKSEKRDVAGQKTKVQIITRLDFIGQDQYTRMREALELPPSIPVVLAETEKLAVKDPLKIYLAIEQPNVKKRFVEWVGRWNENDGEKFGRLEIVSDLAQSDVSLVVYLGADESVMLIPFTMYDSRGTPLRIIDMTAHFVTKDDQQLKVLWLDHLFLPIQDLESAKGPIEKELEKRIKARSKK